MSERKPTAQFGNGELFNPFEPPAADAQSRDISANGSLSTGPQASRFDEVARDARVKDKLDPLIYCIAMVRNEADIILSFLHQAASVFDKTFVVDIQSSDGTKEIIDRFAGSSDGAIVRLNCLTQERYQSALTNTLARKAFGEGADWAFFLDADEFLDVKSREHLRDLLKASDGEVIHLPWINLAPSEYGSFESLRLDQDFFYRVEPSPIHKVAISARYALIYPDFSLEEGNHNVNRSINGPPERARPAFSILHLPVRSASRLKYKLINASRLLGSKHNTGDEEGHHVRTILRRLEEEVATPALLNMIVANYSLKEDLTQGAPAQNRRRKVAPPEPAVARRRLPLFARDVQAAPGQVKTLTETLELDAELKWRRARFAGGAPVCAELRGSELRIRCLPITGQGDGFYGRYSALPEEESQSPPDLTVKVLTDAITAAWSDVELTPVSDWSGLAPVLFALFSVLRPRRFVELGFDQGTSFFAACQAAEQLAPVSQCIGVDSSIRRPQSGTGIDTQYGKLLSQLRSRFPTQHVIHGSFRDALECFDDSSVDLLHIDVKSISESASEIFASWLPKMSDRGTIVLHDISSHKRGYTVWRLWDELKQIYPGFSFYHCNGLGILYVGHKRSAVSQAIQGLNSNAEYATLAQLFFEQLGEHSSADKATLRRMMGEISGDDFQEQDGLSTLLRSNSLARHTRIFLRRTLFATRAKYFAFYFSKRKKEHYTQKKRWLKAAITFINWKLGISGLENKREGRDKPSKLIREQPFVTFDKRMVHAFDRKGLHPNVRLIIPTRGCSRWLPFFLEAYRAWGLEPSYAVDNGCEPETLQLLKDNKVNTIFIDSNQIPNGESIMPFLSKSIQEDYVFRLDDDEFPARELIDWVNSIPDSKFAFVTSWWIPRYEVALLDGQLWSCHPKWMRTKVGPAIYENLHGGRFYRHKDVIYDEVGPHHGNFISDYVSHAPPEALLIHLDYLVRTMEERLNKIRSTEKRFKDAGWPFANHMLPEMAPRELLRPRRFINPDLDPLISELLAKVYRPTERLNLGVDEIVAIQRDRLSQDTTHFHY
ncbi:MAG TPA: glycosyltransferase family 2 protein [Roseiarcus sp.]